MRKLLLAVLLAVAGSANASDYEYRAGYYWSGGLPYERIETQTRYYSSNGCYYYRPSYTYKVVQYPAAAVKYTDPDWRQKLLDIAGQRDKYLQQMKASAIEHNEFLEAVKVLGLEGYGDQPNPRYATSPYNFSAQAVTSYTPNAQQGNSVYGYSYSSIADLYGTNDLQALYQQAGRLTQNAQSLAGDANSQFSALVQTEGGNRARVAEILAKAQLLRAAEPAASASIRTNVTVNGTNTTTVGNAPATSLQTVMATKCYECHSGGVLKASPNSQYFPNGCDLTKYASFSTDQKRRTVELVMNGNMPKDGQPLGLDETALFFADFLANNNGQSPAAQRTPPPAPKPMD